MIERQYCQEQLLRLSGLPGYPKSDDGRRSLVDAFQGAFGFAGKEKLRLWVDDCLRHRDKCPLPRDAYQSGREATPGKPAGKVKCFVCYDSGQTVAEFLVTWKDDKRYRQQLTAEQAAALWKKHYEAEARGDTRAAFAPGKQMIYEAAVKCACQQEAPPMPPAPQERATYEREEPGGAA